MLKALQELNVCWKKIGHYNMKCRWSPGFVETMMHNNNGFGVESAIIEADGLSDKSTHIVKFEIQVNHLLLACELVLICKFAMSLHEQSNA